MYGMGTKTMGERIGVDEKEAQSILDTFFNKFPDVKRFIDETHHDVETKHYVEDYLGRRRRLPDAALPPYEVYYTNEKELDESCFNPILGCKDKQINDSRIKYYLDKCSKCRGHSDVSKLKQEAEKEGITIFSNTSKIALAERQSVNARIQGCLDYNSLIYTKDGLMKIGELSNKSIEVWDGDSWSSAIVLPSGEKQKCVITTSLGDVFITSPDHKFLTCNTKGNLIFKKVSKLTKNDRLVFENINPTINNDVSFRKLFPETKSSALNANNYSFDDIKDYFIRGQVLGRIASDGSYILREDGGSCIYLIVAEHEKDLLEYFKCNLPYKMSIQEYQKKNQKVYRIDICSKSLVKECIALGIKHKIHDCFYKNTDLLRGFISGFFDGDGTSSNNKVTLDFGTQYDFSNMLNDIKTALNMFGVSNTIKKYKDRYRVCIRKKSIHDFALRIGFINKEKQEKALNIFTKRTNKIFKNKIVCRIKSIDITNEYIDMYDVCNTNKGYYVVNGLITHNSAATLTKTAMVNVDKNEKLKKLGFRLLLTIHDELIGECPAENAEKVGEILSDLMVGAAKDYLDVPFKCDAEISEYWYQPSLEGSVLNDYKKQSENNDEETAFKNLCDIHCEFTPKQLKDILDKQSS